MLAERAQPHTGREDRHMPPTTRERVPPPEEVHDPSGGPALPTRPSSCSVSTAASFFFFFYMPVK